MSRYEAGSHPLALTLLCALIVACGGDEPREAEANGELETRAVATALPAGARVVVSGYDVEGFWTRLQGTRLYQQLAAIQDVRQAVGPGSEVGRDLCLELDTATIMNVFGEKFDLGFYGPLAGDRADLLLVARVADEESARTIVEECEAHLVAEKGVAFRPESYAGAEIRVAANSEGEDVLFYRLDGERLTMATTRTRVQQALDLSNGEAGVEAMTSAEGYMGLLADLPAAAIVVYVDQEGLRQAAERAAADTTVGDVAERMRREQLAAATSKLADFWAADAVVFGAYWTEAGIRGDMRARFPEGERSELARMLGRSPDAIRSLAFQPEGTLFYGALNTLDARVVYDQMVRYAVEATRVQMGVEGTADSARADSVVGAGLAEFERETGIDVEEEIVAWVGDEIALAIAGVDKTGFFPIPEIALTIETTDPGRSRALMTKVEGLVTEAARVRASIPLEWQAEQYEGATIRYAPTPMGEGLAIAYTVGDEFVLVGSSRGLVGRMLDARAGRSAALPSNPDFGSMTDFYPQRANSLGFVNLERILTEIEGLLGSMGPMAGAEAADTTSTARRVLAALKNAPRAGFYSAADADGVSGHFLLEVR